MNVDDLRSLIEGIAEGRVPTGEALERLRSLPFADLGYARVDLHRELRSGRPEVIFCQGKSPEQIAGIIGALRKAGQRVLATRAEAEVWRHCSSVIDGLHYHETARIITDMDLESGAGTGAGEGLVVVISAGTSDIPVAMEAALTARACGARVETVFDAGVAGLHRLLAQTELLQRARAVVVVAGMEGALPSVVGGLVAVPVVAVPTSIGYGASFGGVAALLGMLNSCASNVTVVNIDNGFGGGNVAALINRVSCRSSSDAPAAERD